MADIPVVTKRNYLTQYPLKDLCWRGDMRSNYILSSSSGSTGEPYLWPRGETQEREGTLTFELIFTQYFQLAKRSTLYVNCFAMGTWISGPFVLACAENLARQGYPIMSVTPGIDKHVALSLIGRLAGQFDQIVLSGYPPFIKDLLDAGIEEGIDWSKLSLRFLFAAEGFSEAWRSHVHALVGQRDDFTGSINLYGSADAAVLAHETPVTIALRRAIDAAGKRREVFGDTRLPTLAQYDPRLKYFEEQDHDLLFTTNAGLPLIRYAIGDHGTVWSYRGMVDHLAGHGIRLDGVISDAAIQKHHWALPFVSVFGRSDLTVSLYGLLIYPEHIKHGLEQSVLHEQLTGKFILSIEADDHHDPYLLVRLEMTALSRPTVKLQHAARLAIINGLIEVNSEYGKLRQMLKRKVDPVIELVDQGDERYFKQGAKQRWVKKS